VSRPPRIEIGDVELCGPRVTASRPLEGSRVEWRKVVDERSAFLFVEPSRSSMSSRSGRPRKRKLPN
jgi:hypothetical protein